MSKNNNESTENKVEVNPLLFRYPPNMRFKGAISKQTLFETHVEDYGESVTDKESYKLSLAGKRGAVLGNSLGSYNKGWYMFEDGKYDELKDFSYIMRKDLSITEIDRYTEILKRQLEESDESLKNQIENQIKQLNDKKKEVVNTNENKANSSAGE